MRTSWEGNKSRNILCKNALHEENTFLIKNPGKDAESIWAIRASDCVFGIKALQDITETQSSVRRVGCKGGCNLRWNMSQWTLIHHVNGLWRLRFTEQRDPPHVIQQESTMMTIFRACALPGLQSNKISVSGKRGNVYCHLLLNGPCIDGQMEEGG